MGGPVGEQALSWLAPGGRMVTVPTNTALATVVQTGAAAGKTVRAIKVTPDTAQLAQLAALVDQGLLTLHVSAAIPLEEAASAHAQSERGHVKGKLILVP
ncbi:MAG: zinc-binding dehydrogenase [Gammaproteobacteria bacterium]